MHESKTSMGLHSAGFVLCLLLSIGMVVLASVWYLNLDEAVKTKKEQNEQLRSQLSRMISENDAVEAHIRSGIDREELRELAINKYGMKSPGPDQVIIYRAGGSSEIRQYKEIPSGH